MCFLQSNICLLPQSSFCVVYYTISLPYLFPYDFLPAESYIFMYQSFSQYWAILARQVLYFAYLYISKASLMRNKYLLDTWDIELFVLSD